MPRGRRIKPSQLPPNKPEFNGSPLDYNRQIGKNLHTVIKKYYKDTSEFLKLFNITDYTLNGYETGEMEIPAHFLWCIAEHIQIPIETFFTSPPKRTQPDFFSISNKPIKIENDTEIIRDILSKVTKH